MESVIIEFDRARIWRVRTGQFGYSRRLVHDVPGSGAITLSVTRERSEDREAFLLELMIGNDVIAREQLRDPNPRHTMLPGQTLTISPEFVMSHG
jgi:hypothetical protein